MSSVVISGDTSGQVTLAAPAVAGTNTVTLPAATGTAQLIGQGTAVNSTSGTSITFTSIPSWVKRITVMFNGVSTNGSSPVLVQIGSGSVTTTGYSSASQQDGATSDFRSSSAGFIIAGTDPAIVRSGALVLLNQSNNVWVSTHNLYGVEPLAEYTFAGAGILSLSGTLDRVRITTVNGTDTFDAGSINILYEG